MATPVSIYPQIQRTSNDCMIACLAMVLSLDIPTVRIAADKAVRNHVVEGISCSEALRVARRLKKHLHAVDVASHNVPDDTVGILAVREGRHYHALVLFNGTIYDPAEGVLWEADSYLSVHRAKPYKLLLP